MKKDTTETPGESLVAALDPKPTGLALLRVPFPAHQISKLPKESGKQRDERNADRTKAVNCTICGGWHHAKAVHLDYVGHAALTDRLLDADPQWSWEPVADAAAKGLPVAPGGMWIALTVCGVTRLGYGGADGKSGTDAVKEIIGDALRNAAMRFGAALDLWHKGDLHAEEGEDAKQEAAPQGYAEWLVLFKAAATKGRASLRAEWSAASEAYRQHFNATEPAGEADRLRNIADDADIAAKESAA